MNIQKNKKSVVTFSEEITLVEQEIKRQLQIKNQ
jgi:hypothetical protein